MEECVNPCRIFFEQNAHNLKKVERLQQEPDAIAWEKLPASAFSSGSVEDAEQILRLLFNPIHVDLETRKLKPTAVNDAKDKGCSVDRLKITTKEVCVENGHVLAASKNQLTSQSLSPQRSVCGVTTFNVVEVRSILDTRQKQAYAVYDTALENNKAHADICRLVLEKNKQDARSVRLQLMELGDRRFELINKNQEWR